MQRPTRLPENLYQFFWDVNPQKINPAIKPRFVIQRLLDKGDAEAVKWVRKNFSKQDITETFYTMRDFRTKIGRFWLIILNLSQEKVLCLQTPYLTMRRMHWPY